MFDHLKMGEQKQMCIWLNLNLNLKFEFANSLQYNSNKWNVPQTSTLNCMSPLYHVLVHLLSMLPPFLDDCAGNSFVETVITPEEEEDC